MRNEAGTEFLGLEPATHGVEPTRFCVLGQMKEEAIGNFGFWMDVDSVQERAVGNNRIIRTFTIAPKRCLIPWNLTSYVQAGGVPHGIGFVRVETSR